MVSISAPDGLIFVADSVQNVREHSQVHCFFGYLLRFNRGGFIVRRTYSRTIIPPYKSNGKRKNPAFFAAGLSQRTDTVAVYISLGSSLIRYRCCCCFFLLSLASYGLVFSRWILAPIPVFLRVRFFFHSPIASHRWLIQLWLRCSATLNEFEILFECQRQVWERERDREKGMSRKANILFILAVFFCFFRFFFRCDQRFCNHISCTLSHCYSLSKSGICRWLRWIFAAWLYLSIYIFMRYCVMFALPCVCECVRGLLFAIRTAAEALEPFMKRLSGFRNKWNIDESDVTI